MRIHALFIGLLLLSNACMVCAAAEPIRRADEPISENSAQSHLKDYWKQPISQISLSGYAKNVRTTAFSPDGQYVVAGQDDGTTSLWSLRLKQRERNFSTPAKTRQRLQKNGPEREYDNLATALSFSSLGRLIAVGFLDGNVIVWGIDANNELARLQGSAMVISLKFSPDCTKLVATYSCNKTKVWDLKNETRIWNLKRAQASVLYDDRWGGPIAFSPLEPLLAIGFCDGFIRLKDFRSRQPIAATLNGHTKLVFWLAFLPDGRLVSASDDNTIRFWDVRTHQELSRFRPGENKIKGCPWEDQSLYEIKLSDGATILIGGETNAGKDGARWWLPATSRISAVDLSSDGSLFAVGFSNGAIRLIDVETGAVINQFQGHANRVSAVALSPDGLRLVSCSREDKDTLKLWEAGK